ncbi:hypothetical protein TA3x_005116 [Tundrisphaera sp. TA3]|uniref:DUF11 domain-containing protein n=1 Tax=Tundrisphaera sp. TA3 TaxID=3435775 RepID=UPI003EBFA665
MAVVTPFTPRFQVNDTGNIAIVANTLMTLPNSVPNADQIRAGIGRGTELDNNNYDMVYVDIDNTLTTFNSSSATLGLPSGASVLFAGLYWGANSTSPNRGNVLLRAPGADGYQPITGSLIGVVVDPGGIPMLSNYSEFADVTSIVSAAGNGAYTVANVQANTGINQYAGWSLVVAYRAPNEIPRNLTIFDGAALVQANSPTPVTISIDGFVTPPTGEVDADVGVIAYEGDLGLTGDRMSFAGDLLSDSLNPANNFFNSKISTLGVLATAKNPNYVNQMGFDAKIVNADGYLSNGATGTDITLYTTSSGYYPSVVTTAIELYSPVVDVVKSVTPLGPGPVVRPGDQLRYTATATNNSGTSGDNAVNVVLTDTIPDGTIYVPGSLSIDGVPKTDAAGDDEAEYDPILDRVVYRLGAGATTTAGGRLPIAASSTISFLVRVDPTSFDRTVTNQSNIVFSAETSGFILAGISNPVATPVVIPKADLAVTKTVSSASPNVGDQITFGVTLSNLGPDVTTNVSVSDLLPAGLTFISATPSRGTYNPATGLWTIGTVGTGEALTLTIVARVDRPDPVTNFAAVSSSDLFDPVPENNSFEVVVGPQQADLAVLKTVDNRNPNVGGTVTFTVTLSNLGPSAATGVTLTDLLPAGLTLQGSTPSQGSYNPATGLWTVGSIGNGAAATLVLVALVTTPATLTNTATVTTSDQFDPNPGNNTASETETPQQADLVVLKSVDLARPRLGAVVVFTINVYNAGPDTATGVTVLDVLPPTLEFVSASTTQGVYDEATGLWTIGTLTVAGSPVTLTIVATAIDDTPQTNTASINTSDQFDPDLSNNTSTTSTDPFTADLGVIKSVDVPRPNVGDTVTFTVTLFNSGPNAATGVTLGDLLPSGLQYVSSVPSQGTYDPGTGVWIVGAVPRLGAPTLRISARVISATAQTNTATVLTSDQPDPTPGDRTDSATVIPLVADLAVRKTASDTTPTLGQTIRFIVSVRNIGPDNATNVSLTDLLPAGFTFVSATANRGFYDPATGIWTIGTVNTSDAAVIEFAAVVTGAAGINTATIATSDQFDSNLSNNTDSVAVTTQAADLAVTKTATPITPLGPGSVIFTVTVTNNGPVQASGVIVTDLLPPSLIYVQDREQRGRSYDPTTGIWLIGLLGPGESVSLQIVARADVSTRITNIATVTSDQFDPNPLNNVANLEVLIPAPTSPLVIDNARFGYHDQPTALVLAFNVALAPDPAQSISNYTLVRLNARGRVVERIAISSAFYDEATRTVTLHPARRLRLRATYQVAVNGTTPEGVTDTSGVLLGANRIGEEGFDQILTFDRKSLRGRNYATNGPVRTARQARASRRLASMHFSPGPLAGARAEQGRLSARAVDAVLAQGWRN